jgi:hypothetical protein
MNLSVTLAKEALRFQQQQLPVYENISRVFYQKVKEKFAFIVQQLKMQDEAWWKQEEAKLKRSGGMEAVSKVWYAPEFVSKIVDYPYESEREIFSFFLQAAAAEAAQKTGEFDPAVYPYLWTANGDYLIQFDSEEKTFNEYHAFQLNDTITLDFFSPYCIRIDSKELEEDATGLIEEYNYAEAFGIYEKLEESLSPLNNFLNSVSGLISGFTKVLILKKQVHKKPMLFSSASNFPYIGRSLLINAGEAGDSQLTDALVHESIHSLLYMIDVVEKWMPLNAVIHRVGRSIISPWTGRPLNPGNFCQAIFVWYGLFNFWHLALAHNIYDKEYGEKRIATIQKGFEQVEIESLNKKFTLQLNQSVLETVTAVKEAVVQHSSATANTI